MLMPTLIKNPKQNMTAFAFDIPGMLAGTAVVGKPGQNFDDLLQGFVTDLSSTTIAAYFAPLIKVPCC